MPTDDLKQYINSKEDFYASLGVESNASEAEIRRAYRQTARKYHPDKVGAHNTAALEKFHELQIAYDVLSDVTVKELYDNARRAREEQKARQAAFDGRRKAMIDELEARESGSVKHKRDQDDDEAKLERELQRLAEDGKRRRQAREEQLRQEFAAAEEAERKEKEEKEVKLPATVDDSDRSISIRYRKESRTSHFNQNSLASLFSRFGPVEMIIMKEKRRKPPGEKHKIDYWTGLIVFESIVGAHAAVSNFSHLHDSDQDFALLESVAWTGGQEPESVSKLATPVFQAPRPITVDRDGEQPRIKSEFSFDATKHPLGPYRNSHLRDHSLMMRLQLAGQKQRGDRSHVAVVQ